MTLKIEMEEENWIILVSFQKQKQLTLKHY